MRKEPIDYIRSISMLYIVGFWHLFNYTDVFPGYYNRLTFSLTVLALGLFVMVSGYLIGRKESKPTSDTIIRFAGTRLLRIYPPFLAAILTFLALRISNRIALYKSIVLLAMVWSPAPTTLWFVTMICVFYVIAPILIANLKTSLRFLLVGLILYSLFFLYSRLTGLMDKRLLLYFPLFAAGIFIGSNESKVLQIPWWFHVIAVPVTLMLSHGGLSSFEEKSILLTPFVLAGSLSIFVLSMNKLNGLAIYGLMKQLSYASYFMYLFHRPIFSVMRRIWMPASGLSQALYLLLFCLPLIVVTSWLGQKLYDWLIKLLLHNPADDRAAAGSEH